MKTRIFDVFFTLFMAYMMVNLLIFVSACSNDESIGGVESPVAEMGSKTSGLVQKDSVKMEYALGQSCDSANEGKKVEAFGLGNNPKYGGDEYFFKCHENEWIEIDEVEYECEEDSSKVGDKCVIPGRSAFSPGVTRYFYLGDSGWVNITQVDFVLDFCTDERESEAQILPNYEKLYVCHSNEWKNATEEEALDYDMTVLPADTAEGSIAVGPGSQKHYVMKDGKWVLATRDEVLGDCTKAKEGKEEVFSRKNFRCHSENWELVAD